jgi:hypothetical protein
MPLTPEEVEQIRFAVAQAMQESAPTEERITEIASRAGREASHEIVRAMGFDPEHPEQARTLIERVAAWFRAVDSAKAAGWTAVVRMIVGGIGILMIGGIAMWVAKVVQHHPK